jgi:hypothetical protein
MIYITVIVTSIVSAVIVAYHCIDNFGVGINEFKARYKKQNESEKNQLLWGYAKILFWLILINMIVVSIMLSVMGGKY